MTFYRIAIITFALFVIAYASADDATVTDNANEPTLSVSEELYASVNRVVDDIEYLANIGISHASIDPKKLPFTSKKFLECVSIAANTYDTRREQAIGRVSCFKRHSDELWMEVTE